MHRSKEIDSEGSSLDRSGERTLRRWDESKDLNLRRLRPHKPASRAPTRGPAWGWVGSVPLKMDEVQHGFQHLSLDRNWRERPVISASSGFRVRCVWRRQTSCFICLLQTWENEIMPDLGLTARIGARVHLSTSPHCYLTCRPNPCGIYC